MGSKETKRKYAQKRRKSDKVMSDLYKGIGGRQGESFTDFKIRVKKII
jgi:hypothetical protein